jgi:hypothetical protein
MQLSPASHAMYGQDGAMSAGRVSTSATWDQATSEGAATLQPGNWATLVRSDRFVMKVIDQSGMDETLIQSDGNRKSFSVLKHSYGRKSKTLRFEIVIRNVIKVCKYILRLKVLI